MWHWYNRPGGRATLPIRTLIVIFVVAGLLVGVIFMGMYIVLAPILFTRVPG